MVDVDTVIWLLLVAFGTGILVGWVTFAASIKKIIKDYRQRKAAPDAGSQEG